MSMIGSEKKKEIRRCHCSESNNNSLEIQPMLKPQDTSAYAKAIIVLGTNCGKCRKLTEVTKQAVAELNIQEDVEHVTDLAVMAGFNVVATPALVINGEVVSAGAALKLEEVVEFIKERRGL